MIATINLLWIIPLSTLAGGFIWTVLVISAVMNNMHRRDKHESCGVSETDKKE